MVRHGQVPTSQARLRDINVWVTLPRMTFPSLSAIFNVYVLVSWSGKGSCWTARSSDVDSDPSLRYTNDSMIFDPSLGSRDARCSCDKVDR